MVHVADVHQICDRLIPSLRTGATKKCWWNLKNPLSMTEAVVAAGRSLSSKYTLLMMTQLLVQRRPLQMVR